MGKVLLIEPYKILQHAMVLCLFPGHDIRVKNSLSDLGEAGSFDVLVIDAASLRETAGLSSEALLAVKKSSIPTVWIDRVGVAASLHDRVVAIEPPATREALQKALAQCLAFNEPLASDPGSEHARPASQVNAGSAAASQVIELVEVVDEGVATGRPRQEQA